MKRHSLSSKAIRGGKIKIKQEHLLPPLPPPSPEEQIRQQGWRMIADIRQRQAQRRREFERAEAERAAAAEAQLRVSREARPEFRTFLNEQHDVNPDHNEVPRALRSRAIRILNNQVFHQFNNNPAVHTILEEIATTGRSPHDNDYIDTVLNTARRTIDDHIH